MKHSQPIPIALQKIVELDVIDGASILHVSRDEISVVASVNQDKLREYILNSSGEILSQRPTSQEYPSCIPIHYTYSPVITGGIALDLLKSHPADTAFGQYREGIEKLANQCRSATLWTQGPLSMKEIALIGTGKDSNVQDRDSVLCQLRFLEFDDGIQKGILDIGSWPFYDVHVGTLDKKIFLTDACMRSEVAPTRLFIFAYER